MLNEHTFYEALSLQLLKLPLDSEELFNLVRANREEIDNRTFWVIFRKYCREQDKREYLAKVSEICVQEADEDVGHFTLLIELLEELMAHQLIPALDAKQHKIDADLVDTLVLSINDDVHQNSAKGAFNLLTILDGIIEHLGWQQFSSTRHLFWFEAFLMRRDYQKAKRYLEIHDINQELFEGQEKQRFLSNQGILIRHLYGPVDAAEYYDSIKFQVSDSDAQISMKLNQAGCFLDAGQFNKAETLLLQLMEIAINTDEKSLKILGNMQWLFSAIGRYDLASELQQKEFQILEDILKKKLPVSPETIIISYYNSLLHFIRCQDVNRAQYCFERCMEHIDYAESEAHSLVKYEAQFEYYRFIENKSKILSLCQRLSAELLDLELHLDKLNSMLMLAGSWLYCEEWQQAEAVFRQTLVLAEQKNTKDIENICLGYLANIEFYKNNVDSGMDFAKRFHAQQQELRDSIGDQVNQFFYSHRSEDMRRQCISFAVDKVSTRQLFELLQLFKSPATNYNTASIQYSEFIQQLPPKTLCIEFAIYSEQAFALASSATLNEPVSIKLEPECYAKVQNWHKKYLKNLKTAPYIIKRNPFEWMYLCYKSLFEPVLSQFSNIDELIIIPGEQLAQLPVQIFPDDNGRLLIEKYAISQVVSVNHLYQTAAKQNIEHQTVDESFRIMVDGCLPKFEPLELMYQEAKALKAMFSKAQLFEDGEVLPELESNSATITHLCCHGSYLTEKPLDSGLWLSHDNKAKLIGLQNLTSGSTASNLVFFSGCNTGRGVAIKGGESLGIHSILTAQKVQCAILSLWPVPGENSNIVQITTDFYDNWLNKGMTSAKALQKAMLSAKTENPINWACFAAFGWGG